MMIWDDFVKKEELETAPGVIDGELVQALMINTYPTYIREIIDTGENLFPEETAEQLETAMEMTFMSYIHTFEGRYPTPDEIVSYMEKPGNAEMLESLINLCLSNDLHTWPETERKIRETLPMHKLEKINWDSAERKENAEKLRKRFDENGGMRNLLPQSA